MALEGSGGGGGFDYKFSFPGFLARFGRRERE